jgi:hypothetical protein
MKKKSWLLIAILAVACDDDEPKDPTVSVSEFLGEYQSVRSVECTPTPPYPLDCETIVQDSVLLVTQGTSDSAINVLGFEVLVDSDGKFICCPDLELVFPLELTIQNDTLKTMRRIKRFQGIYDVERFIGVKGATAPLKAGSVGFRAASSEELENIQGPALIYLDIESAKFGAAIIIDILNTSTAISPQDYSISTYAGDAQILSDNKIVVNVLPNVTSATIGLHLANDFVSNPSRTIQFQISVESVGIVPSEKKNHSITIVDDD